MIRAFFAALGLLIVLSGTANANTGVDETHLTPNAVTVAHYVEDRYPEVPEIDGWRPLDPFPDHPSGKAIDIMVFDDRELGDRILNDLLSSGLPIRYTIWQQRVRRPNGSGYLMADRGSPRQNHQDHLHISVY